MASGTPVGSSHTVREGTVRELSGSRRHRLLLLLGRRRRRQLLRVLQHLVGALPAAQGGTLHAAGRQAGRGRSKGVSSRGHRGASKGHSVQQRPAASQGHRSMRCHPRSSIHNQIAAAAHCPACITSTAPLPCLSCTAFCLLRPLCPPLPCPPCWPTCRCSPAWCMTPPGRSWG